MQDSDGNGYKVDSLPSFNMELKGNSAEGNIYDPAMKGYGATAAPARHADIGGGSDAPGAFIMGNNPANATAHGSEMSGNKSFNPTENSAT